MKQLGAVLLLVLMANIAFAQVNDNCSGAITLTATAAGGACPSIIYTNVGASEPQLAQP